VDRLWAGWRSEYVRSVDDAGDDECLFCSLPGEEDAAGLILERGRHAFTVLNRYPYTTGHLMVSQYRHASDLSDLTAEERDEVWCLLVRGVEACRTAMGAHGCNVGANLGRVAGAGVPGHLHVHVVPRWSGDTNFMTTVGETRVLPEDLADTWARLRDALGAAD
jgi:ATP adenylyltransferase